MGELSESDAVSESGSSSVLESVFFSFLMVCLSSCFFVFVGSLNFEDYR